MILLSQVPSSKHVQISLFSFCCIIFSCHLPNIDLTFVNIYFFWHNVILSTVTRISNAICNWATVSLKFKFFWSSRFYFTVIIYIISNLWYGKNTEEKNLSSCWKISCSAIVVCFLTVFYVCQSSLSLGFSHLNLYKKVVDSNTRGNVPRSQRTYHFEQCCKLAQLFLIELWYLSGHNSLSW